MTLASFIKEIGMEVGKSINRLSNHIRSRSNLIQKRIGITGVQGNILYYILMESQIRTIYQRDIEKEFSLKAPTVTEILKILEQKELIRREVDKEDTRRKKIIFSDKASKIKDEIEKEIKESEDILLKGVTESERKEFLRIAGKMLENIYGQQD